MTRKRMKSGTVGWFRVTFALAFRLLGMVTGEQARFAFFRLVNCGLPVAPLSDQIGLLDDDTQIAHRGKLLQHKLDRTR